MSPREPVVCYASDSSTSSELEDHRVSVSERKFVSKQVSFGSVSVREHNRTVGDHPETSAGPPIGLDWQYIDHEAVSLKDYEENRKKKHLRLSGIYRRNLLKTYFGVAERDVDAAERESAKIRRRREFTNKQSKFEQSLEHAIQSARRKFKRTFSASNKEDDLLMKYCQTQSQLTKARSSLTILKASE